MTTTPTDPLVGTTIAHYTVVAKLGGGGMGVVYKAIDGKLGRTVALKFLPPQWSHDEGAKQRFMREAQAASATNHRNICVIHDIDHTEDGRLFIVMAYYEGQTLKQRLESGPPPIGEALEIATEVAEGLAKAHAQGVVHRDIKPGNLVVSDDGVKILDFGLAKFADALQLTIPGSTIGTSGYMSPEQARGEEADARSDVWALGVVMYEMLTGEVPFKGAYPEAIFYAIKTEPVPPLRAQGRDIPETVETIVMRALEKDPDKRYQTARELVRDLRLLLGRTVPVDLMTGPLPPLPLLAPPKPLSRWQRMRAAMTPGRAIAAAVVVVAAVVGSYLWFARPVVRIPVAIAPVANHTGEPELDGYRLALTETLLEELGGSPNIRVVPYLRLVEIIRRFIGAGDVSSSEVIQAVASQSGASVVLAPALEYRNNAWLARVQLRDIKTGTVTKTLETASVTSPLPKDAAQRLMVSLADVLQAEFKANGPGRSYVRRPASSRFLSLDAARAFAEGLAHYEQWEYSAALAEFRRVVSFDDQHPMAHAWLSRILLVLNQPGEAAGAAKRAKQLITPDLGKSDLLFIDATLAESQNDFDTAGARYTELARARPDEPAAQLELADFLKRRNRDQEAIGAYREALRRDTSYIRPHVDLCQLYTRIDEYPLADEEAKSAAEKYKAVRNSPGEAQALLALSELRRRQGDLTAAKQTAEQAREIFESLRLEYGLSRVYQYLAIVAGYSGDYRMAVRFFEEALSRSRQIGNRRMEVIVLENLGVAHERLGQRGRAIEYYQQSLDGYQAIGDERLAAHQEANVAILLIDYGTNQPDALRRLVNAYATFQKLGDIEFEVIAMEYQAVSALHAGRHNEARRRLQQAMTMAKDRRYGNRDISMTVRLAESYFATSDYETARKLLEDVAATDAGRDDREVALAIGRIYVRLGDLATARTRLEQALKAVNASEQLSLLPTVHTALGELEYESGRLREARTQFEKAASFWTDDLADAASVEARCHLGSIDALERKAATAIDMLAAIDRATKMGRLYSETQCRLDLARIYVGQRRFAEALSVLSEIPNDGDRTIGRELQAHVHYWRSRALREQGRQSDAQTEATQAATLIREVQESLPEDFRMSFATRRDIRVVTE